MTQITVAGALASKPRNGGEAWVRLSYALGLRRLGCTVQLVEETPKASLEASQYATRIAARFELEYLRAEDTRGGDLLVNISGNVRSEEIRGRFTRTALVDIDPGFTQLWHERGIEPIPEHDVYFTIGANIGRHGCEIPTCGIEWRHTRPPVVLDEWPVAEGGFDRFTTVATWRSPFGPIEPYGLKHHQWRALLSLPRDTGLPFEAALVIDAADGSDRVALEENGWLLVDPAVAATPDGFRDYVRGSGAEFSVAQGIYVETRSGWFSDRSVRYLASGRPVLVQDTGLARDLPLGDGLLTFEALEDAAAGAHAIVGDYPRHARAARAIAEEHFDSDKVLSALLEDAL